MLLWNSLVERVFANALADDDTGDGDDLPATDPSRLDDVSFNSRRRISNAQIVFYAAHRQLGKFTHYARMQAYCYSSRIQ